MSPSAAQPEAVTLAVHTTGPYCAVRLQYGEHASTRIEAMARGHAEALPGLVEAVVREGGARPENITRIAVATGPGAFAGTRVGIAFARGLALAANALAVGVLDLDALALEADSDGGERIFAIHDARRGEAVWRSYIHGEPQSEAERGAVETALEAARGFGPTLICGSGAGLVSGAGPEARTIEPAAPPLAAMVALARQAGPDAPRPAPFYARPPDAKLPGGVKP
ncbi:MAG: tRNA (adenosine(37)-N6)-threonylcarbamoyltransferase complex dimerization subunit type 1 TsaB [Pseudomonadota bacterium]